jgi:8-oxo-dGTP diphosphatase
MALNLPWSNMEDIANFTSGSVRGFIAKEGRVLLVKEKGEENWETPGGRIRKSDENPIETCKREILEETGYRVNAVSLLDVSVHVFEMEKEFFI